MESHPSKPPSSMDFGSGPDVECAKGVERELQALSNHIQLSFRHIENKLDSLLQGNGIDRVPICQKFQPHQGWLRVHATGGLSPRGLTEEIDGGNMPPPASVIPASSANGMQAEMQKPAARQVLDVVPEMTEAPNMDKQVSSASTHGKGGRQLRFSGNREIVDEDGLTSSQRSEECASPQYASEERMVHNSSLESSATSATGFESVSAVTHVTNDYTSEASGKSTARSMRNSRVSISSKTSAKSYETAQRYSQETIQTCESNFSASLRVFHFLSSKRRWKYTEMIWNFFQDPDYFKLGWYYERAMRYLILISVVTTLVATLPDAPLSSVTSAVLETTIEAIFLTEIMIRFFVCPSKTRFWFNGYNLIDLTSGALLVLRASLGFELSEGRHCDMPCSLLVGMAPVVRLLKMLRRMHQFHLLYKAFVGAYQALPALMSIYAFFLLLFTGVVFIIEPRTNVASMPEAAWLTFVSMSTLGYGDVTPQTGGGAVVISLSVISAMLYMGIPVGIIGSTFNEVWNNRERLLGLAIAKERLSNAGYSARELPGLFDLFDSDKDGQLEPSEFHWMMQGLKLNLTREQIHALFKQFDHNQSGAVSQKEFVGTLYPDLVNEIYGTKSQTPKEKDLRRADSLASIASASHARNSALAKMSTKARDTVNTMFGERISNRI